MSYELIRQACGEQWGPLAYVRLCSDEKGGVSVWVGSASTGKGVEVRVSPKGRVIEHAPMTYQLPKESE